MNEQQTETIGPATLMSTWMKTATAFWEQTLRQWPGAPDMSGAWPSGTPSKKGATGRPQETLASALKTWQSLSELMSEPSMIESQVNGIGALPEIILKMVKSGAERYLHLQHEWVRRVGKIGERTKAYEFENLDQELFKAWSEIYDQEFRQLLNMPQLGLTRFYQERMNRATDEFSRFQTTMAEFMHVLFLPMDKSFNIIQEKLLQMAEEGTLPENPKDYYQMWIKILEGHYMTLFKSSEYIQVLQRTIDRHSDFLTAKQALMEDFCQMLPVPTHKEMDELYKELYHLKKKIKMLEKKMESVQNGKIP